jgi:hypothetical protein
LAHQQLMNLSELMVHVWKQSLAEGLSEIEINGRNYRVTRTRSQGLRIVSFLYQDQIIDGIEQNPLTTSRWAKLAQDGKRIMQFRCRGRFIANVCEERLTRYPSWKGQGLPD